MCSAPNVYMFVYTLIGTHIVPLRFGNMLRTMPKIPLCTTL